MSAKNDSLLQIEEIVRIYTNFKYLDTNVQWVLFILAEYISKLIFFQVVGPVTETLKFIVNLATTLFSVEFFSNIISNRHLFYGSLILQVSPNDICLFSECRFTSNRTKYDLHCLQK